MQITSDDLKKAIFEMEKIDGKAAGIAVFYLKKELRRRNNSGRPTVSALSRKEQVSEAVKRFRSKKDSGKSK